MDLSLGTPVTYHHRAAVARYLVDRHSHATPKPERWVLLEGCRKDEWSNPFDDQSSFDGQLRDRFSHLPPMVHGSRYKSKINKTVMVWPEDGSGIIIGKVRRQRGTSHTSSGYDENYDPGYFDVKETFELYAVKHSLEGTQYVLVPTWAVAPIHAVAS